MEEGGEGEPALVRHIGPAGQGGGLLDEGSSSSTAPNCSRMLARKAAVTSSVCARSIPHTFPVNSLPGAVAVKNHPDLLPDEFVHLLRSDLHLSGINVVSSPSRHRSSRRPATTSTVPAERMTLPFPCRHLRQRSHGSPGPHRGEEHKPSAPHTVWSSAHVAPVPCAGDDNPGQHVAGDGHLYPEAVGGEIDLEEQLPRVLSAARIRSIAWRTATFPAVERRNWSMASVSRP